MKKLFILIMFSSLSSFAQDVHFSQFDYCPTNTNPGQIGRFDGQYRFIANQRTQWSSITVPYQTISLSADAFELNGIKNTGMMFSILSDQAGDSKFSTTQLNFGGAYKLNLDSISNLNPAIQLGWSQRKIDMQQLTFDNQYNGYYFDSSLGSNEQLQNTSFGYLNVNIGILYERKISDKLNIESGLSLYNLTKPHQSFFSNDAIRLNQRIGIQSKANYKLQEDLFLQPSLFFASQGKLREFIIGTRAKKILDASATSYRAISGGIWMRAKDAGFLSAALDYNAWRFGISYDVNLSTLTPASSYRGGFEFSIVYILRKLPPLPHHKICPTYI